MTDEKTIAVYDQKAADYAALFTSAEASISLKDFMKLLPRKARVLDWGCGPATASHFLKEAGFNPDPIDASPEMVSLARAKYGLTAKLGTFDDPLPKGAYQGAWANFSLVHGPRRSLPGYLAKLQAALQPGGILHLGMKRGIGENRDRFGRFYTYYQSEELHALLKDAGFEIIKSHEGEETGLAGSIDPFVLILARKKGAP